jgi:hypothetical protein
MSYHPSYKWVQRLIPSTSEAILPYSNSQKVFSFLWLETILLEFDQYLVIFMLLAFQHQYELQGHWAEALVSQLYVPTYFSLRNFANLKDSDFF